MMLPQTYELPAALVLLVAGGVACFAGYRLFRIVLAIFGFILGAMITSSVMGISNGAGMVGAALLGGVIGALILLFAYFVGIAIVGAGVGALLAHFGSGLAGYGEPPLLAVVTLAIAGAIGAMFVQRHVIIAGTALVGAWTLLVGFMATIGDRAALGAKSATSVWILYPMSPAPGHVWLPYVWIALGIAGMAVQMGFRPYKGR
jgi:hypothetical protein